MGTRSIALIALLLGLILAPAPARAGWIGDEDDIVNPWTTESPSGEYRLSVMPSEADGSGPATYTMKREGKVLWKTEHPFTLREGAVTDKGEVAGYAYSHGYFGIPPQGESSTLNAIILNPDGTIRLNAARSRRQPLVDSFTPLPNQPVVLGWLLDTDADRLVLQTRESFPSARTWFVHRFSTGELVAQFDPWQAAPNRGQFALETQVSLIPETPLVAVQWGALRGVPKGTDAVFDVLTLDGKLVWTRRIADEWTEESRPTEQPDSLPNHPKRRMWVGDRELTIASGAQREIRRYTIAQEAAAATGWRVSQQNAEPWVHNRAVDLTANALTPIKLERLGRIELEWPAHPPDEPSLPAIGSAVDRRGGVLLQHSQSGTVHRFNDAGRLTASATPAPVDFPGRIYFAQVSVDSEGRVWAQRERGGFVRFAPDGTREGVDEPLSPRGHEARLAQPSSTRRWILRFDELLLVDGDGSTLRRIARQPDGGWLQASGVNAAVGPSGDIVVRSQRHLCVYDASGEPVGVVRTWDADIRAQTAGGPLATNGDWIAENDSGMILLYRVSRPNDPPFRFVPPREKGQEAFWDVVFSPDGRELWIRNADSFTIERYRLPD